MMNQSNLVNDTMIFSWTIPMEVLLVIFSSIGFISSIVFISIVMIREEFRENLNLLLAANLSLGGLISGLSLVSSGIYMLNNSVADKLCPIRGYFYMSGAFYICQAAALQTLHRLFVTVFVHRRRWQNRWLFMSIALTQLLLCLLVPLPLLLSGHFPYVSVTKLCYIGFNDLLGVLYPCITFYVVALIFQSVCSWWILRFVSRETAVGSAQINVARRVQKERRVLARLAFPVMILVALGFFFLVFFFGTNLTSGSWKPPPYASHLSFVGDAAAIGLVMFSNILLNREVREIIWKMMPHRHNAVNVVNQR